MPTTQAPPKAPVLSPAPAAVSCYHCGEACDRSLPQDDHFFCCEGCRFVYGLLQENGLCNYYDLSKTPGIRVRGKFSSDRFAYLDNEDVQRQLLRFTDGRQSHAQFHLPQMHCASCIWLLENLHAIRPGVLHSTVNFGRKELFIAFDPAQVSLRQVVELLAFVGYEPEIRLGDADKKRAKTVSRKAWYQIGVAGFCFSNIMMLAFPDYFASGKIEQESLKHLFSYVSLLLALPVFFYSASGFFISAFQGLRQKMLNIDAPIALSIGITFSRSVYEVLSGAGPGYFDSMSGIVLFMLVGRWFQNKTYDAFSFDRDYKSYFPLGITRLVEGAEQPGTISDLKAGDRIVVRHGELVPADAVLRRGEGYIDYSFVSGENTPLHKRSGELVYAGARQTGGRIELEVVKTVSQSYITQLWNNNEGGSRKHTEQSFIHPWSRYFTLALFSVAAGAGLFWSIVNPANVLPAVSAALIVACPCSLLLSATFTFGNMLRHFGRRRLYLKNASVIESLAKVDTVVLDKTGTLTCADAADISFTGKPLSDAERAAVYSLAKESVHPLSRLLARELLAQGAEALPLDAFEEVTGKGLVARLAGQELKLGSFAFVNGSMAKGKGMEVWIAFDGTVRGCFSIRNRYRAGVPELVAALQQRDYRVHLLSGDNDAERERLVELLGDNVTLAFNHTPQSKLEYIKLLQAGGATVLMLGDGLNDAGALMQANAGVAVTENTGQFTPACDAILDAPGVRLVERFLAYARSGKRVVTASFILSICYNIVGVSIAVQAAMKPMVAAILMPVSSISIVTLATLATGWVARKVFR
ncbi:HAD family hydrolase [Flaviaesturariibacter flavus]|uniref:HAD family hydrolase n=1 Tax=Flaviaesturariibacter flavus TaxID=2502780 RepID=A0A4R1B6D7_9BACT|nr:heavy metal translocating P-type ATPase metal-binding domain-containing protein [Flaviaesturariibacter flavus]TCJ13230.1 HAD family hydrolase [Flaviaesturariibacter flavus]